MDRIDLNSDLGESFGAYRLGNDEEIIRYVTAANIACGWHAGDPMVMDRTVRMAKEYGVSIGAHPGYPDLMGFGRRSMKLTAAEVRNYVKYQIGALQAFAVSCGAEVDHVAPHGALGNLCQNDREASRAICEAVLEINPKMTIYFCAGAVLGEEAEKAGLRAASEIFADRAYLDDYSLAPRSMEGAVITDESEAIARCIRMVREHKVISITGKDLSIRGDTLCVHGDSPKALNFVKKIRSEFQSAGIEVCPLSR